MNKKTLFLLLILLISVVLVVSCSPDPIKKNKIIGTWEITFEYEPENSPETVELTITATVKEGEFSLELTEEGDDEVLGTAKGTWTAKTTTDGVLTFTEVTGWVEYLFEKDDESNFAATDDLLFIEAPDSVGEAEAMVLTRK